VYCVVLCFRGEIYNPAKALYVVKYFIAFQVFDFLFALPNPRKRYVPKCKSQLSRSSAYDLLVEMVKGCPDNYRLLHEKLLAQHKPGKFVVEEHLSEMQGFIIIFRCNICNQYSRHCWQD
jgi:hypothetical protein